MNVREEVINKVDPSADWEKDLKEFNGHSTGELINKINNFKGIEALVLDILLGKIIDTFLIIISSSKLVGGCK